MQVETLMMPKKPSDGDVYHLNLLNFKQKIKKFIKK
jgi:hypothetical protein